MTYEETYRGIEIYKMLNGYAVCVNGDEVYFDSIEDARGFIDETLDDKEWR